MVVTLFRNRLRPDAGSDYDAWLAALALPDVLAQIRADEANFLESSETRMWAVSPLASDYSNGDARRA